VFLQYLLGLRLLGYQPLFIDCLTAEMALGADGRPSRPARDRGIEWLRRLMGEFGFEDSYILLLDDRRSVGIDRSEALQRVRDAALLLNVTGFLADEQMLAAASRRVFLDIDPGFPQMWRELGQADILAGHDDFVTFAQNIGAAGCRIPTCGLPWITTRPPVVLEHWPRAPGGSRFTSIGAWRGPYDPVEYHGDRYGLRAHEFRRFAELPPITGASFEVALDIAPADRNDIELLERNSWKLVEPRAVAGDPDSYRAYIQASAAEFMVAKNMYVKTHSGWFSDRSVCYLASGKPVLAQDTGLSGDLSSQEGLLTFTDLDEAARAVAELERDPVTHERAARAVAERHFDARTVLARLLEELEVR